MCVHLYVQYLKQGESQSGCRRVNASFQDLQICSE